MPDADEEIRQALEEVLALYDINLETQEDERKKEVDALEDYSEIISKTQQRLDELNEKAEEIYTRTGMDREQLEAYASNPNNFSKEQWEALQKVKEACEKYKRQAHARIGEKVFEEKVSKKRKPQAQRFAKKKHWIPL